MNNQTSLIQPEQIEQAILLIRGQRVMLDRDLAALYGVETKNLNKAVRRNLDRFPADFMFQLTLDEAEACAPSRFQFGTLKRGHNIKYLPQVFTQEGVAMLSSVLRSPRAVQVNIAIMRVFVRLRGTLALHKELAHKLTELERKIEGHDTSIRTLFDAIHELAAPPATPRWEIGYLVKEAGLPYFNRLVQVAHTSLALKPKHTLYLKDESHFWLARRQLERIKANVNQKKFFGNRWQPLSIVASASP
jgi:hypothetical protein